MKSIWKYALEADEGWIEMPQGAKLLSVAVQSYTPMLWALIDMASPLVRRHIRVVGTGWSLEDADGQPSGTFIGTFMVQDDELVFHVFDMGESPIPEKPVKEESK